MNLAIYGAGLEGEKFFCRWKNEYDFKFVIDQNNRNGKRFFHGLKVYTLDDVKKLEILDEIDCIVITTNEEYYNQIQNALSEFGNLEEGKDYCSVKDFLWKRTVKKKAILYGNCHMIVLNEYLKSNVLFMQKYDIKVYAVNRKINWNNLENDLAECDLLISQDIRECNSFSVYDYKLVSNLCKQECVKIKIPNLFGMNIYFPNISQIVNRDEIAKMHTESGAIENDRYKADVIHIIGFRDVYIERWMNEKKKVDEIVALINCEELWSEQEIKQKCRKEINKLKEREKQCDISISDYIERNYKKRKLFFDPYHPSADVIIEKGKRILNLLDIPIDENIIGRLSHLDSEECFIYGCVKSALELEFQDEYIKRYSKEFTLINEAIDLEEYIKEYICWNSQ